MRVSEERLQTIEARCAAATPGPWEAGKTLRDKGWLTYEEQAEVYPPLGELGPVASVSQCDHDNADLIAHARTDLPDLAADLREARARNNELEAELAATMGYRHVLTLIEACRRQHTNRAAELRRDGRTELARREDAAALAVERVIVTLESEVSRKASEVCRAARLLEEQS